MKPVRFCPGPGVFFVTAEVVVAGSGTVVAGSGTVVIGFPDFQIVPKKSCRRLVRFCPFSVFFVIAGSGTVGPGVVVAGVVVAGAAVPVGFVAGTVVAGTVVAVVVIGPVAGVVLGGSKLKGANFIILAIS